jgi:hypothetical protein
LSSCSSSLARLGCAPGPSLVPVQILSMRVLGCKHISVAKRAGRGFPRFSLLEFLPQLLDGVCVDDVGPTSRVVVVPAKIHGGGKVPHPR